jgi:Sigma-70, region 4
MPVRSSQLVLLDTRATPETRGECEGGARPCQFTNCRKHLYAIDERAGRRWNKEQRAYTLVEVHTEESCVLDVVDAGQYGDREDDVDLAQTKEAAMSFADIGKRMGITGERARQIYEDALDKMRALKETTVLHLELESCSDCPCMSVDGPMRVRRCEYPSAPLREVPNIGVPDWCPVRQHPLLMGVTVRGGKRAETLEAVKAWQDIDAGEGY